VDTTKGATPLFFLQQGDVLNVMGVGEHVHRLDFHDAILLIEHGDVARLGENIADQGGLRIAYDAFKTTQQFRDGKMIDGFTPAQRFYLSYGRIWADNMTEEAIFQQTKSDPHSIGRYRVNATLRNIDTFFDAFGIKAGDKMWLDPADRAIIW
jgi:predicted metalloendopeptidase